MKRAKIVATFGPSLSGYEVTKSAIQAGVNVARLNLSHGSHEVHEAVFADIRKASDELRTPVGILVDLQGPKIRLGKIAAGPIDLADGDIITITTEDVPGDRDLVSTTFKGLPDDVKPGDPLLIDDGNVPSRCWRPTAHAFAPRPSSAVASATTRASTCPASPSTCRR